MGNFLVKVCSGPPHPRLLRLLHTGKHNKLPLLWSFYLLIFLFSFSTSFYFVHIFSFFYTFFFLHFSFFSIPSFLFIYIFLTFSTLFYIFLSAGHDFDWPPLFYINSKETSIYRSRVLKENIKFRSEFGKETKKDFILKTFYRWLLKKPKNAFRTQVTWQSDRSSVVQWNPRIWLHKEYKISFTIANNSIV